MSDYMRAVVDWAFWAVCLIGLMIYVGGWWPAILLVGPLAASLWECWRLDCEIRKSNE